VLAVAVKWTGDDMEVPVFGDETVTVANVGSENNTKQGSANFRNCSFMFCPDFLDLLATNTNEAGQTNLNSDQLRFNALQQSLVHMWK